VTTNYPARTYTGVTAEDTTVSLTDAAGSTYTLTAPASNISGTNYTLGGGGAPMKIPAPAASYVTAIVYSTETPGVYQSSVQPYVGASRSNVSAGDKGTINIKYDANP
jgi:hypothetical protein